MFGAIVIVLIICVTIITCVLIYNCAENNYSIGEATRLLREMNRLQDRIEKALNKLEDKHKDDEL